MYIEYKYKIIVESVCGKCVANYSPGQTFEFEGLYTPAGFCGGAYYTMFPLLYALQMKETDNSLDAEKEIARFTCPERATVTFKIIKVDPRPISEKQNVLFLNENKPKKFTKVG